jgi:hypothetical protein
MHAREFVTQYALTAYLVSSDAEDARTGLGVRVGEAESELLERAYEALASVSALEPDNPRLLEDELHIVRCVEVPRPHDYGKSQQALVLQTTAGAWLLEYNGGGRFREVTTAELAERMQARIQQLEATYHEAVAFFATLDADL